MSKKKIKRRTIFLFHVILLSVSTMGSSLQREESTTLPNSDYHIWTAPSTMNIQRDTTSPLANTKVTLEMAGNESQTGQVVLSAINEKANVTKTSISTLKKGTDVIPAKNVDIFVQHYVKTTFRSNDAHAPGWYPDALIPLESYIKTHRHIAVKKGQHQALLYTVKTASNTPAGKYSGKISVTVNGKTEKIPITVNVRNFSLPKENHAQTAFAIWDWMLPYGYPDLVEGSDRYWHLMKNYYAFLLDYHVTPTDLPIPMNSIEQYVKDAKAYVNDPRVSAYSIPYYIGDFENGNAKKLVTALKNAGLLKKAYYYLGNEIDEPTADMFDTVKKRSQQITALDPTLRHIVTTSIDPALTNDVQTFTPLIRDFDDEAYLAQVKQLQADGKSVWWYSCVIPRHPYPSYHIDDDIISARLMPWMQKSYGIEGNLYWSVNVYAKWSGEAYVKRDIWNDPLAFEGANGDGVLLYPGAKYGLEHPIATLRLLAIRDGNQDYEYLWLLEDEITRAAKRLKLDVSPQQIMQPYYDRLFQDVQSFTKNIDDLQQVRTEVANLIEALQQDPKALQSMQSALH